MMRRRRYNNSITGEAMLEKGRLEAFSDGVIAIILTIMVLELKAPETAKIANLLHEWPIFMSYVISFTYVAVYWINHHQLFHRVRHVDLPVLWANIALLFWLSLVPFFTEWMEATRLSPLPTAVYAGSLLMAGVAFSVLDRVVARQSIGDEKMILLRRAAQRKNAIAIVIYTAAIVLAFYRPTISLALMFLVAVFYAVPSLWVERCADELESRETAKQAPEPLHPPFTGN